MKKLYAFVFAMLLTVTCASTAVRAQDDNNFLANDDNNDVTTTAAGDNDMDWGWLGLLGLVGLAGLRGRERNPQR